MTIYSEVYADMSESHERWVAYFVKRFGPQLSQSLKEWHDFDTAGYHLAVAYEILKPSNNPNDAYVRFRTEYKHVFWTDNPLGNMIGDLLHLLYHAGLLERNDGDQYRWKTLEKVSDK